MLSLVGPGVAVASNAVRVVNALRAIRNVPTEVEGLALALDALVPPLELATCLVARYKYARMVAGAVALSERAVEACEEALSDDSAEGVDVEEEGNWTAWLAQTRCGARRSDLLPSIAAQVDRGIQALSLAFAALAVLRGPLVPCEAMSPTFELMGGAVEAAREVVHEFEMGRRQAVVIACGEAFACCSSPVRGWTGSKDWICLGSGLVLSMEVPPGGEGPLHLRLAPADRLGGSRRGVVAPRGPSQDSPRGGPEAFAASFALTPKSTRVRRVALGTSPIADHAQLRSRGPAAEVVDRLPVYLFTKQQSPRDEVAGTDDVMGPDQVAVIFSVARRGAAGASHERGAVGCDDDFEDPWPHWPAGALCAETVDALLAMAMLKADAGALADVVDIDSAQGLEAFREHLERFVGPYVRGAGWTGPQGSDADGHASTPRPGPSPGPGPPSASVAASRGSEEIEAGLSRVRLEGTR